MWVGVAAAALKIRGHPRWGRRPWRERTSELNGLHLLSRAGGGITLAGTGHLPGPELTLHTGVAGTGLHLGILLLERGFRLSAPDGQEVGRLKFSE